MLNGVARAFAGGPRETTAEAVARLHEEVKRSAAAGVCLPRDGIEPGRLFHRSRFDGASRAGWALFALWLPFGVVLAALRLAAITVLALLMLVVPRRVFIGPLWRALHVVLGTFYLSNGLDVHEAFVARPRRFRAALTVWPALVAAAAASPSR